MAKLEEISAYFDKSFKKLSEDMLSTVRKEISDSFKTLTDNYEAQVAALKQEFLEKLNVAENRILDLEESLERNRRINQVTIRNIPSLPNSDMHQIFQKISSAIGFDVALHGVPHIFRINKVNASLDRSPIRKRLRLRSKIGQTLDQTNGNTSVAEYTPALIIATFCSVQHKSEFMRCYFKKKTLKLKDIGLSTDLRIFVGDNLTPQNSKIFSTASQLKKNKVIYSLSTKHGQIWITLNASDKPVVVASLRHLNALTNPRFQETIPNQTS